MLLFSFHKWRHWSLKSVSNLSKVMLLDISGDKICVEVYLVPRPMLLKLLPIVNSYIHDLLTMGRTGIPLLRDFPLRGLGKNSSGSNWPYGSFPCSWVLVELCYLSSMKKTAYEHIPTLEIFQWQAWWCTP